MYVVIIGAGLIGSSIAEFLVQSGHDVVALDRSKERLDRLEDFLELRTLQGHGCDPADLRRAHADRADVLMALTGNEEVNLIAAATAKRLGARKSVARARSAHYLTVESFDFRHSLGIDLILSPEMLTAGEIIKFLDNPDALTLEFYAQGKVQLIQFELAPDHEFCGRLIKDLELPGSVLVVLVSRETEILIPHGEVRLLAGDKVTLLGKAGTLSGMRRISPGCRHRFQSIIIAGGSQTGRLLAASLESRVRTLKILESNMDRCRELGAMLSHATVLAGDATDRNFLVDERIGDADVFIATMGTDEDNIMAALLAKKLGAKKCIVLVKRADYTPLIEENTSIDLALNPREVTAARVLNMVKSGRIHNISLMEDGRAEIIELAAHADSPIVGRPLRELNLPRGCLVGFIIRGNAIRIPRGDDQIKAGDSVIMVALTEIAERIESLF